VLVQHDIQRLQLEAQRQLAHGLDMAGGELCLQKGLSHVHLHGGAQHDKGAAAAPLMG
jgi:hypothetical protein